MKKPLFIATGLALGLLMTSCGRPVNSDISYIAEDERHAYGVSIDDDRKIPNNNFYSDTLPNTDYGIDPNVDVGEINVPRMDKLNEQLAKIGGNIQEVTPTAETSPTGDFSSTDEIPLPREKPPKPPIHIARPEPKEEAPISRYEEDEEEDTEMTKLEKLMQLYAGRNTGSQYCDSHVSLKEYVLYGYMIQQLGGEVQDPSNYTNDLIGFQKFLSQSKVKYFSAYEMTKPGNHDFAKECGTKVLLPPKGCWLRSATMALFSDKIRGDLNKPVLMTSHFRPECYNELVKGAKYSDHLEARSSDLAFRTVKNRKQAQKYICKTFWKDDLFSLKGMETYHEDDLNISIGLGNTFMHVGLGSVKGRRYWIYKSYIENNQLPEECWVSKMLK